MGGCERIEYPSATRMYHPETELCLKGIRKPLLSEQDHKPLALGQAEQMVCASEINLRYVGQGRPEDKPKAAAGTRSFGCRGCEFRSNDCDQGEWLILVEAEDDVAQGEQVFGLSVAKPHLADTHDHGHSQHGGQKPSQEQALAVVATSCPPNQYRHHEGRHKDEIKTEV